MENKLAVERPESAWRKFTELYQNGYYALYHLPNPPAIRRGPQPILVREVGLILAELEKPLQERNLSIVRAAILMLDSDRLKKVRESLQMGDPGQALALLIMYDPRFGVITDAMWEDLSTLLRPPGPGKPPGKLTSFTQAYARRHPALKKWAFQKKIGEAAEQVYEAAKEAGVLKSGNRTQHLREIRRVLHREYEVVKSPKNKPVRNL